MDETHRFAGAAMDKAEQFREDAKDKRRKAQLHETVVNLSKTPQWKDYGAELEKYIETKVHRLLRIRDNEHVALCDRQRAILCAEIDLLGNLLKAPERSGSDIRRLLDAADDDDRRAAELETMYGFTKGARE